MNKKVVGILFSIAMLFALPLCTLGLLSSSADAQEVNTIFKANVSSILSLSIEDCSGSDSNVAALTNTGAANFRHFSSCFIKVKSTTNAPGYNLMIQSIDGVQRSIIDGEGNWKYDMSGSDTYAIPYGDGSADGTTKLMQVTTENTPPTLPTLGSHFITSTSGSITSPTEMNAASTGESVWGFAVPKPDTGTANTNFDAGYTTYSSNGGSSHGRYAKVPTTASSIRITSSTASEEVTNVFFGVSVAPNQAPGTYKGVVVFTATINPVPNPAPIVVAVYPDNGPLAGGTTLDVYGTNFTGVTGVTVGGTDCGSATFISDGHVTCILPTKSAGVYSVVVTTAYGVSNDNVKYTYTTTPTEPGPNPYEPSGDVGGYGILGGYSIGGLSYITGETAGSTDTDTTIEPLGRSVFENLAESIGDEDYNNLWLAIGIGALLSGFLIFLAFLFSRKYDVYIMDKLDENRSEIFKILVEKVGIDVNDVVKSLELVPSLVVEGISKGDAKTVAELLEKEKAKVIVVRHGRNPDDNQA